QGPDVPGRRGACPEVVRRALQVVLHPGQVPLREVLTEGGQLLGCIEVRLVEEVQLLHLRREDVLRAAEAPVEPARPALLTTDDEEVWQRHASPDVSRGEGISILDRPMCVTPRTRCERPANSRHPGLMWLRGGTPRA